MTNFRDITKLCKHCQTPLKLNNTRDIDRKKYCNKSCKGSHLGKDFPWLSEMQAKASTPEANAKKSNKGEKNGRYIQDRSLVKTRSRYECSEWRKAVFERDDYTCQICGVRPSKGNSVRLNADHIKEWCNYPELRYELDNGRTLCEPCHKQTDNYAGKALKLRRKQEDATIQIGKAEKVF